MAASLILTSVKVLGTATAPEYLLDAVLSETISIPDFDMHAKCCCVRLASNPAPSMAVWLTRICDNSEVPPLHLSPSFATASSIVPPWSTISPLYLSPSPVESNCVACLHWSILCTPQNTAIAFIALVPCYHSTLGKPLTSFLHLSFSVSFFHSQSPWFLHS